jgi:hypothetical protein
MRRVGLALALFAAAGLCLAAGGAPDPKSLLHVQATLTTAAPGRGTLVVRAKLEPVTSPPTTTSSPPR